MATVIPDLSLAQPANADVLARRRGLPSQWSALAVAGLVAVAFVLRWHAIATKDIWNDEAFSFAIARLRWTDFFKVLELREANMAAYYLVLRGWLVFGHGAASLRSLSVIFSIATVPILYALGVRLSGRATAFAATGLFVANAFAIRYAQEARSYSMLTLLVCVASLLFVRNIERPLRANWLLYAIVSALALYAQLFAVLAIAAQVASVFTLPKNQRPWRDILKAGRWFACMTLPFWVAIYINISAGPIDWVKPVTIADVGNFLSILCGNGGTALIVLTACGWLLAALSVIRTARSTGRSRKLWRESFALIWLVVPVTLALVLDHVHALFIPRYLLLVLPASLLFAAAGFMSLGARWRAVLVVALIAGSVQGTLAYYRADFDNNRGDRPANSALVWPQLSRDILRRSQPGDGLFFLLAKRRILFDYYRHNEHPENRYIFMCPKGGDELSYDDFLSGPILDSFQQTSLPARVWFVMWPNPVEGGAFSQAWLQAHYHLAESRYYGDVQVSLYQK